MAALASFHALSRVLTLALAPTLTRRLPPPRLVPSAEQPPRRRVGATGRRLQVARGVVASVVPLVEGPLTDLVDALRPARHGVLDACTGLGLGEGEGEGRG